jgi:uncharacterized membrane protein YqjE
MQRLCFAMAAKEDQPQPSLWSAARGWLHDAVELLHVRLSLLGVEAQEHALDAALALAAMLAAAILVSLGLGFLAILLTVVLWDSYRVLVLAIFGVSFLTGGALVLAWALRGLRRMRWFAASIEELGRDVERLRGRGP